MLAEQYILLDSLLFKIITTPEKETVLLAIPEVCIDKIITLYHSSLFAGHQGVLRTYLTSKQQILYPRLNSLFAFIHPGMSYLSTIA